MPSWLWLAVLPALLVLPSCSTCEPAAGAPLIEEEQPRLVLSRLDAADPGAAHQLLRGFHRVEQGSWRWTEKRFAVALKPPRPGKPATIELAFFIPGPVIATLHTITLAATAGDASLPAQAYSDAGKHLYRRTVPAAALRQDPLVLRFHLDQALAPSAADSRELGLIVSYVELR